jgi:hypothetical protein
LFSGVYYVKGNKESGTLAINDPRPGIQTMMPARKPGKPPKHPGSKFICQLPENFRRLSRPSSPVIA